MLCPFGSLVRLLSPFDCCLARFGSLVRSLCPFGSLVRLLSPFGCCLARLAR
ncbi:MAG: hypothetical protein PHR96_02325 [Clostridia bacterium]|nr:hypothetical protein [Clostridia bacterium]